MRGLLQNGYLIHVSLFQLLICVPEPKVVLAWLVLVIDSLAALPWN